MTVKTEPVDGATVVAATGEIDIHTAPRLGAAVQGALSGSGPVLVDLTAVRFMDSSGLGELVKAHGLFSDRDRRMALACSTGPLTRLLSITGVDQLIEVYPDRSAGLAALSS